jgi:hypothetical protein
MRFKIFALVTATALLFENECVAAQKVQIYSVPALACWTYISDQCNVGFKSFSNSIINTTNYTESDSVVQYRNIWRYVLAKLDFKDLCTNQPFMGFLLCCSLTSNNSGSTADIKLFNKKQRMEVYEHVMQMCDYYAGIWYTETSLNAMYVNASRYILSHTEKDNDRRILQRPMKINQNIALFKLYLKSAKGAKMQLFQATISGHIYILICIVVVAIIASMFASRRWPLLRYSVRKPYTIISSQHTARTN